MNTGKNFKKGKAVKSLLSIILSLAMVFTTGLPVTAADTAPAGQKLSDYYVLTLSGEGEDGSAGWGDTVTAALSLKAGVEEANVPEALKGASDKASYSWKVAGAGIENSTKTYASEEKDYDKTVECEAAVEGAGTLNAQIIVGPKALSEENTTITAEETNFSYNGKNQVPAITSVKLKSPEKDLNEFTDFLINNPKDSKNAGDGKVVSIIGTGKYTGTVEAKTYSIAPVTLGAESGITLEGLNASYTYTGASVSLDGVTVKKDGTALDRKDYDLSFTDGTGIKAGKAGIVVTGKRNYNDAVTKTDAVTITPKSFISQDISVEVADESSLIYTGSPIKLEAAQLKVSDAGLAGDEKTVAADDFEVSEAYTSSKPEDFTSAGVTVTMTVKGKTNYTTDARTINYTIKPADITTEDKVNSGKSVAYTGKAVTVTPEILTGEGTLTVNGKALTADDFQVADGTYKDNVKAGTASVQIKGTGNYTGTATVEFSIGAKEITDAMISGIPEKVSFTGKEIKPEIQIKDGDYTLKQKSGAEDQDYDYEVSYSNNEAVGDATVSITGHGNYSGTPSKNFEIEKIDLNNIDIQTAASLPYTGIAYAASAEELGLEVKSNVKDVEDPVLSTDYTVEVSADTAVGNKVKVTIKAEDGSEHFKGTVEKEIPIVKAVIGTDGKMTAGYDVSLEGADGLVYDGTEKKPSAVSLANPAAQDLIENTDYTVTYAEDTKNAGDVKVTFTAKGDNYEGSFTTTYTIQKSGANTGLTIALAEQALEDVPALPEFKYTGLEIEKEIVVSDAQGTVSKDDYTVKFNGNKDVGEATATITMKETAKNYKATVTKTSDSLFKIVSDPKSITEADVIVAGDFTYNGKAQPPVIKVVKNNVELVVGTDYRFTLDSDFTSAGEKTVTIIGLGNYDGCEVTKKYSVAPKEITDKDLNKVENVTFTGAVQNPVLAFTDAFVKSVNGVDPEEDTDFEVSVTKDGKEFKESDFKAAGKYVITIKGIGNLSGSVEIPYEITPVDISAGENAAVLAAVDPVTYGGESTVQPEPDVTYNGKPAAADAFTKDTDYKYEYENSKQAGTATVKIVGIGNYTGSVSTTYTVEKKAFTESDFQFDPANADAVSIPDQVYVPGKGASPVITAKEASGIAKDQYMVTYANNTSANDYAMAIVVAREDGNYSGVFAKSFKINKCDIKTAKVTASNATYNGSAIKPAVKVTIGGITLSSADYSVAYKNNVNAGTAAIAVTGKGNYTGTASGKFTIAKKAVSKLKITTVNKTYTGKALSTTVTVKDGSKTLKNGTNYTVKYSNNKNIGTAKVTITGKGNYTGSVTKTFTISPKKLGYSSLKSPKKGQIYVKVKRDKAVTGYQMQVAKNSKFTSGLKKATLGKNTQVSKTFTKLSAKKTYYVRVRSYKKVSGKTYYGAWVVKKVKTK